VKSFQVLDPDINFSNHLSLYALLEYSVINPARRPREETQTDLQQSFPRWDKADRAGFYKYTGDNMVHMLNKIDEILCNDDYSNDCICIDEIYAEIVCNLTSGENLFVSRHSKNFYKYW